MTEEEKLEAYRDLLAMLREYGGKTIADDIEATVVRGAIRESTERPGLRKSRSTEGGGLTREPLSAQERLTLAARMLLAAASTPLMLHKVADLSSQPSTAVEWQPDFVEDGSGGGEPEEYSIPSLGDLLTLRAAGEALLQLVDDQVREA